MDATNIPSSADSKSLILFLPKCQYLSCFCDPVYLATVVSSTDDQGAFEIDYDPFPSKYRLEMEGWVSSSIGSLRNSQTKSELSPDQGCRLFIVCLRSTSIQHRTSNPFSTTVLPYHMRLSSSSSRQHLNLEESQIQSLPSMGESREVASWSNQSRYRHIIVV